MRAWMLPWLLPVGLLVAVALITVASPFGYLFALAWGWVVFPYGAAYIRSHARNRGGGSDRDPDGDTHYWRTRLL